MSIRPLSEEVISQIRSSTTITSLNGVVAELMKNSLDANAQNISIDVDFGRGGCVVEDDGQGIMPSEFGEAGGLGKIYHTSKINTPSPVYGHQGSFLTSLSGVALVSITSHHHQHASCNTLVMHKSHIITRQLLAPTQSYLLSHAQGTKVTVRDLFGTLPVRVKQRAILAEKLGGNSKDWEHLKHQVVLILLSWNRKVSVTLRGKDAYQKMVLRTPENATMVNKTFDEKMFCSILSQAAFITPDDKSTWVSIGASTSKLVLSGAVSLDPSATKSTQFISLGIYPLFATDNQKFLHDEINRYFSNSNFGKGEERREIYETENRRSVSVERFETPRFASKELKGKKKGIDCWPKFFFRIESNEKFKELSVLDVLDQRGSCLSQVLQLLEAMISAFLTKYHFQSNAMHRKNPRQGKGTNEDLRTNGVEDLVGTKPSFLECYNSVGSENSPLSNLTASWPPKVLSQPESNIKIPTFRRSRPQFDRPFDTWSRTKSGTPMPHPHSSGKGRSPSPLAEAQKFARTRPPAQVQTAVSSECNGAPQSIENRTPLFSRSGQVARRPFSEVFTMARSQDAIDSSCNAPGIEDEDDLKLWINPMTKSRSFVNTRTGITALESKNTTRNGSSDSNVCTQKRLIAHHNLRPTLRTGGSMSPWLTNVLENSQNPVFQPSEMTIPQISFDGARSYSKDSIHGLRHHCSQTDINRAFEESSRDLDGRVSKEALKLAEVISQLDNKFILVKVGCSKSSNLEESELLLVIDQHAADERVRIETLMQNLCAPSNRSDSGISTTMLGKPIAFELPAIEIDLLRTHRQHFAEWGILYDLPKRTEALGMINKSMSPDFVIFKSLPLLVQERCKQEPKLLKDLVRTELWKVNESNFVSSSLNEARFRTKTWPEKMLNCPQDLVDLLNSRACRSAIMFNDVLTWAESEFLVRKLADCHFPFQCAHGRPSLVPLIDIKNIQQFPLKHTVSVDREGFGSAFKSWRNGLV